MGSSKFSTCLGLKPINWLSAWSGATYNLRVSFRATPEEERAATAQNRLAFAVYLIRKGVLI